MNKYYCRFETNLSEITNAINNQNCVLTLNFYFQNTLNKSKYNNKKLKMNMTNVLHTTHW